MSYHMNQERGNNKPADKPAIEMPPITESPVEQPEEAALEQILPETQETAHETVEAVQEPVHSAPEVQRQSPNPQESFRELREKAKRLERERDEALRANEQFKLSTPVIKQTQPTEEEDIHIGDDDLAEGKHLKKLAQNYKKLEQEFRDYQQQSQAISAEQRLANDLPNFAKIVNKATLDDLKEADPDGWEVLANSSANLYARGKMAYNLIKNSGVLPVEDNFVKERLQAHANAAKPRPLTSANPQQGDTPMSKVNAFANGLTPELQAQLRKEMEDARRAM
jgi:hypothetical protein